MTERKKTQNLVKARLHPIWVSEVGYRYSVIFEGKLLVERSRDPECDAARALLAMGITGQLTLLDGKTGKPRIIINIEKAARLRVEEGPNGPRFVKWRGTVVDGPYTAETEGPGRGAPQRLRGRG
jgi:hypothetical protein